VRGALPTSYSNEPNLHSTDYRGHWCPFCRAYLTTLQSLSRRISAAGGKTLIITAEPEPHLIETRELTGYTGEAIVDTQHSLVQYFRERSLLNVAITEKKGYEYGMAQPAILVIKNDGTILENWAIVPYRVCSHQILSRGVCANGNR
jgi:peroxiredoxin